MLHLRRCWLCQIPSDFPDKLGIEHIRDYRRHLLSRGLKAKSINPIVGALRFFYGTTLGDKALAEQTVG